MLNPSKYGFRGLFRFDPAACAVYSEAAGIQQIIPRAIAIPLDVADVEQLVRWSAAEQIPLIPRGSGSSMAGGAVGDGVVVDLSTANWIDNVNLSARTVRCGPGALRNTVDAKARAVGLTFPVDPSSGAFCTVGGMVSTNAAGSHTLKYGAMRPWIEAIDCVFADGSRGELRRGAPPPNLPIPGRFTTTSAAIGGLRHSVRKDSSGYGLSAFAKSGDLVDLLAGSEGTLALIVGVELRLTPVHSNTASLLGAFSRLQQAVDAASLARDAGASACELIDRTFLDVARHGGAHVPVPLDAECVLLVEVEGDSSVECEVAARAIADGFLGFGATSVELALDRSTEHAMWELRHAASPVLNRLDPSLKSMQIIEDGCVPPPRLAEYVSGVRAALDRQRFRGVIFGHAGDAHVHANALIDVREPEWHARAMSLLAEVTGLIARLGGTLTGEHGDGRLRTPLLDRVWPPEALAAFAEVKLAFDPLGILNPGVKVPLRGSRTIDVKYDPGLPALAGGARAVLDRVERERAYARPRLELLVEGFGS